MTATRLPAAGSTAARWAQHSLQARGSGPRHLTDGPDHSQGAGLRWIGLRKSCIGRKLAPVHLLAAAPSPVDWVARGIASVSLVVSITSVVVTIILWRRSGWKLELRLKHVHDNGTPKWAVEITNIGRQACEVAQAGLIVKGLINSWLVDEVIERSYAMGPPMQMAPSASRTVYCSESDLRHCIEILMQPDPNWAVLPDPDSVLVEGFAETGKQLYYSAEKIDVSWMVKKRSTGRGSRDAY